MKSLSGIDYKNDFVSSFPGDESGDKRPRQTPGVLYSKAIPTPVPKPELIGWSEELANELGLQSPSQKDVSILGGNLITGTMQPYAACYAGHQFGNWAGQLGDGRAITLGEIADPKGAPWELQLKGPGPTPYSRRADGRAVLRSSVREYLMSEAMYHLGVPTTRALSLVSIGEPVMRDMFYDGHPANEPGAIVMRVAPSFLRFGNFEILAARKEIENLRQLTDWTIARFFPHIKDDEAKVITWFAEVVERTAALMVEWLRVGFVHGVMNTDNMSILGLTIDYGPYSFLDEYDPAFTPNTTDLPGKRYAFGKQPSIGYWNLGCLAGALAPLFPDTKELVAVLETFEDTYLQKHYAMMANKLGLDEVKEEDRSFIALFEKTLFTIKPDMTLFYQLLIDMPVQEKDNWLSHFEPSFYAPLNKQQKKELQALLDKYVQRLQTNTCTREESQQKMRANNPRFVLRNYLLHQAIEELQEGKRDLFDQLHAYLKTPYAPPDDRFFAKRPEWAESKAGCSMLSCSS